MTQPIPTIQAPEEGHPLRSAFFKAGKTATLFRLIGAAVIFLAILFSALLPIYSVKATMPDAGSKTYSYSALQAFQAKQNDDKKSDLDLNNANTETAIKNLKAASSAWTNLDYAVNAELYFDYVAKKANTWAYAMMGATQTPETDVEEIKKEIKKETFKFFNLFSNEIEKQNVYGLNFFFVELTSRETLQTSIEELQQDADKYLIGKYKIDENFLNKVDEINSTMVALPTVETFYDSFISQGAPKFSPLTSMLLDNSTLLIIAFFLTLVLAFISLIMCICALVAFLKTQNKIKKARPAVSVLLAVGGSLLFPLIAAFVLGSAATYAFSAPVVWIVVAVILTAGACALDILSNKQYKDMENQLSAFSDDN